MDPNVCSLRIQCEENRSWIEIERRSDGGYRWFELRCAVDIGHGRFTATNADLQFLNGDDFVAQLVRFDDDRSLTPQLDGTYGSFLIFWQPAHTDDVMLSFAVGDAYCHAPVTTEFSLTGSFRLPRGILAPMTADFRTMLGGTEPV